MQEVCNNLGTYIHVVSSESELLTANVVKPSHHFQLPLILSYLARSLSILMKQFVLDQWTVQCPPEKTI